MLAGASPAHAQGEDSSLRFTTPQSAPQRPTAPNAAPAPAQRRPANPLASRPASPTIPVGPTGDPVRPPAPADYERTIFELSEALGSLAFLGALCGPGDAGLPWLRQMEALLESEGDQPTHRDRMRGAYNQGFSTFSTTYRQCSPAASVARGMFARDVVRLSRELERRFGG